MLFYWLFFDDCTREIVTKKKIAFSSSLELSPHILLQEQQTTMPQCLTILHAIDPVNNMIAPHVRYSIPERFVIFQSILTHYKNEAQGKYIGGDINKENI